MLAVAIDGALCNVCGAVVVGGPLGYIAGVFLVRKEPGDAEPSPEEPAEYCS